MSKTILVIGAGAAGLMAAISAARKGAIVTILEAQERPGKKLLVTGNGRCNLTSLAEWHPRPSDGISLPGLCLQSPIVGRGHPRPSDGILAEGMRARDFSPSAQCEAVYDEPVYHGTGAQLAERLTAVFGAKETISFFRELGLLTQERNGSVYPYSMQASSVLEVLLAECRRLRVKLKFSQKIHRIRLNKDAPLSETGSRQPSIPSARFSVETPGWTYHADAVILACGSPAAPSTGASEEGYQLAKTLGHSIIKPRPALVPLTCSAPFLNQLAGVRCRARVTLLKVRKDAATSQCASGNAISNEKRFAQKKNENAEEEVIATDIGELQWTKYGVSGIVIFQLSRYLPSEADVPSHTYVLRINLLPDYDKKDLETLLTNRAAMLTEESLSVLLRGILNEKLIPPVLARSGQLPKTCGLLRPADFARLCHTILDFRIPVTGTKSFDMAQVCAGGVDCREITDELESCLQKGLYFAGELLDVDGPCGGYNLQWAWTSGYLAGSNAASENFVQSRRGEAD